MLNSTRIPKMLLAFALLIGMGLQGCVTDNCGDLSYTHAVYTPEIMSSSDFRAAVEVQAPRAIKNPGKIYLKDQILILNEVGKGVHIIDNKNPENPQQLAFVRVPGNYDIAFNCDKMYLDSSVDLLVFDMSDPTRPSLLTRQENAFPHIVEYQGYTANPGEGIIVAWNKEIKTETYNCETGVPSLWEMNQVDPTTVDPQSFNTSRTINPAVAGKAGSMSRFTVLDDHMYVVLPRELVSYDVSNCANPVKLTTQELSLWNGVAEMVTSLNDLLLVGSSTGVMIYSTDNPEMPSFVSQFEHVQACDPVVAQGDYAYVTLRNGQDQPCGNNFTNQLDILDIKNPASPFLVTSYSMYNPHGLGLDNDLLFIADGKAGLKVYDATEPTKVGNKLLKHFDNMQGYDVIAHNGVLILTGEDGIAQYDYSNLDDIRLLSQLTVE
ncbi:MAG: hypothetical protein AAFR61_14400 [Bacteroidota bacterium]